AVQAGRSGLPHGRAQLLLSQAGGEDLVKEAEHGCPALPVGAGVVTKEVLAARIAVGVGKAVAHARIGVEMPVGSGSVEFLPQADYGAARGQRIGIAMQHQNARLDRAGGGGLLRAEHAVEADGGGNIGPVNCLKDLYVLCTRQIPVNKILDLYIN
ncbi:hypothetical protein E4T56_gene5347, partial [Termitomyces sp. T112]